jgi:hypothetical protein
MKSMRRHVLLAAAFLIIVGLMATTIPLMLFVTSDQQKETLSDSGLVVDRQYTLIESAIACVDRTYFEQLNSLARSGDTDKLTRLRQSRIAQFECVKLIKGMRVVLDELDGRNACLRVGTGFGCEWTDIAAIKRMR